MFGVDYGRDSRLALMGVLQGVVCNGVNLFVAMASITFLSNVWFIGPLIIFLLTFPFPILIVLADRNIQKCRPNYQNAVRCAKRTSIYEILCFLLAIAQCAYGVAIGVYALDTFRHGVCGRPNFGESRSGFDNSISELWGTDNKDDGYFTEVYCSAYRMKAFIALHFAMAVAGFFHMIFAFVGMRTALRLYRNMPKPEGDEALELHRGSRRISS